MKCLYCGEEGAHCIDNEGIQWRHTGCKRGNQWGESHFRVSNDIAAKTKRELGALSAANAQVYLELNESRKQ